jgi:2'-5' RNA ligase
VQLPQATFRVGLDRVVPMGNPKRYSALSALLSAGREEIEHMIARTRDTLCDAAGAPRDERPPKPHITLARPQRKATHPQRQAGLQWADAIDLRSVDLRLSQIALYTAAEDRNQKLFQIVAQRELEE